MAVRVFPKADNVARAMADAVAERLARAVAERGSASLVLAGGGTPRGLYQHLAALHRHAVPWTLLRFFWGDERLVPRDDDRSNYRMARESLLDPLSVPAGRVHPIPADADPQGAAVAYERTLRSLFGEEWPPFDLVLLGVGSDGHTASLFPGAPELDESQRWVVPATAPVDPRARVTLTLPALAHARELFVLATGAEKAAAVREALTGNRPPRSPAARVHAAHGRASWWLDADAARQLEPPIRS